MKKRIILLLLVILSVSCAPPPIYISSLTPTSSSVNHGRDFINTIGQPTAYVGTCPVGLLRAPWKEYKSIKQYRFAYSTNYNATIWVAYALYPNDITYKYSTRPKEFISVPGFNIEEGDYAQSGMDRGHMRAASHTTYSKTAYLNTYKLVNVMPQFNYFNKTSLWRTHEIASLTFLRDNLLDFPIVYIIVGSILGTDHYARIGANQIPVPVGYFRGEWYKKTVTTAGIAVTSTTFVGYIYSHNVKQKNTLSQSAVRSYTNFNDMKEIIGITIP